MRPFFMRPRIVQGPIFVYSNVSQATQAGFPFKLLAEWDLMLRLGASVLTYERVKLL